MKEFTSQTCTTIEQSKRLLDLGLKPETADMCHFCSTEDDIENPYTRMVVEDYIDIPLEDNNEDVIPAWSLHRLIHLCGAERMPISFHKKGKTMIRVNHIHPTHNGRSNYNHYDSLIDCIEWLINEGYFNKEYLKQ